MTVIAGSETSALGHDYSILFEVINADCENGECRIYQCSGCGETIEKITSDPLGHKFMKVKDYEPTCTEDGYTLLNCPICGMDKKTDIVEAYDHYFTSSELFPATCTEDAYQLSWCVICKEEIKQYNKYEGVALGHDYGSWVVLTAPTETKVVSTIEATCDKAGYDNLECTRCHEQTVANIKLVPHVAGNWIVEELPTEESEGSMYLDCAVCLKTVETRPVPRLAVAEESDSVIINGLLKKLEEKMTLEELYELLPVDVGSIKAYLPDGSEITDPNEFIGTGCSIRLWIGETVTEILTAIVEGDINGDGVIGRADSEILSKHYAGLEGYEEQILNTDAADLDGDGEMTRRDAMLLARQLAGWN